MSALIRVSAVAALCAVAVACGPVRARPTVLADAAAAADTPQSKTAAELAPTSFAEAERLRREADRAYAQGDPAGAQILGEQALAAYARAFVHARIARATQLGADAKAELSATEADLQKLDEEQARAAADVAALETKIKVARDALPPPASDAADPAREAARLDAARAITTEARLLCVSARLLAEGAEGLAAADAAVADVQKLLVPQTRPAPIDAATRARAACLSVLTKVRRGFADNPAADAADALLAELSREGSFSPFRDDRGVVVTIDAPFTGDELAKPATAKVELAGKIAAAHPELPVVLVVHDASPQKDETRDTHRGDAAKRALAKSRTEKVRVVLAGATRPIVDAKKQGDRAHNERLEIVFVDGGKLPSKGKDCGAPLQILPAFPPSSLNSSSARRRLTRWRGRSR